MSCWVYVLKSLGGDHFYVGSTENVPQRVEFHNSSRARWTKRYQPWQLVHTERFGSRGEAVTRERALKRLKNIGRHLDLICRGEI